ncbi:MAG: c-type cytochrome, partial [Deltaproteobacteria bacterium]|nr:c-type cytochrome [Deltaproteobacteria bacterium]
MTKRIAWVVATVLVVAFSGAAIAADGASLYASKCKMCHGDDGQGTLMGPKVAGDITKGDAGVIKDVITKGRLGGDRKFTNFPMGMPGIKMSDEELDSVVKYLK